MGQTVYVLMGIEGEGKNKMWRPVAVVSNPDVATQWMEYGKGVDWVPLELDDVKNISPGNAPTFHERETTPGEEKLTELNARVEATIERMQKIIDDQAKTIKRLTKGQKTGAEDTVPPKPVGFSETLDAQGLADYIEAHASYEVDPEFVYEMFRGAHGVLKLMPIADLREGNRNNNERSKKNEDKYLKQSLKTQPPVVVEKGEVLDGNHRFRANKRRGLTHMWCYDVVEGD